MTRDPDTIYPDSDDGTRCQTPLGGFRMHATVGDGSLVAVVFADDDDIFYHEDAGDRNDWTVYPAFDLRAVLDETIADNTNWHGEIDADACAALEKFCSEMLSNLQSLPRIKPRPEEATQ